MINWGIIGPGGIARVFCNGLRFSQTGRATAVASRERQKAADFARMFDIANVHDGYDALLADPAVDAVYIAAIHPAHLDLVRRAAAAKKHILVEKPMGMNSGEVGAMIEAARANDVFLMEAFMYRCHPQIQKMADLLGDGAIGEVRVIRSAFGFNAPFNPDIRSYNRELGGGGILDVGCYPASAARRVAGAAAGETFLDPVEVKASGVIGASGVDYYTAAVLKFANDIVAEIGTGVACGLSNDISVYGSEGTLVVPNPWLPSTPCRTARDALPLDTTFPPSEILLTRKGETETIVVEADRDLFTYEADAVAQYIDARQAQPMTWADSEGNMRLLDAWRAEIGLRFPQDG